MSNIIGLVFKLHQKGIITREDAGNLSLEWGDYASIDELIHLTVRRKGLGEWIAKGSRQELAKHFACEDEAVQINGLEVPYHDPRGSSGMGLVYRTSPRGACHNQSDYFLIDMGQVLTDLDMDAYDRQGGQEKAKNVAIHQDWRTVANALVICIFANVPVGTTLELVNTACGLDWQVSDLMRSGERGWNLKRAINNRLGLTRKNDILPKVFSLPYDDHPAGSDGYVPDIDSMLDAYYHIRGWIPKLVIQKG